MVRLLGKGAGGDAARGEGSGRSAEQVTLRGSRAPEPRCVSALPESLSRGLGQGGQRTVGAGCEALLQPLEAVVELHGGEAAQLARRVQRRRLRTRPTCGSHGATCGGGRPHRGSHGATCCSRASAVPPWPRSRLRSRCTSEGAARLSASRLAVESLLAREGAAARGGRMRAMRCSPARTQRRTAAPRAT